MCLFPNHQEPTNILGRVTANVMDMILIKQRNQDIHVQKASHLPPP